jgi:hypothetical protein
MTNTLIKDDPLVKEDKTKPRTWFAEMYRKLGLFSKQMILQR